MRGEGIEKCHLAIDASIFDNAISRKCIQNINFTKTEQLHEEIHAGVRWHGWLGYLQCTEQVMLVYTVKMVQRGEKSDTLPQLLSMKCNGLYSQCRWPHKREKRYAPSLVTFVNRKLITNPTSAGSYSCMAFACALLVHPSSCTFAKAQPLGKTHYLEQDCTLA